MDVTDNATKPTRFWQREHTDLSVATTAVEVMEMRKQETRRRVTHYVIGTLCVSLFYLIVAGEEDVRHVAIAGLLSLGNFALGHYFGAKQAGE